MSKIRLHGSSSGYTEIAPVAASGNNTLTLPNDGTIISKDSNGAVGVTSITVGTGVTIGDGRVTCSTLHGSAANCTQIPAANIVGVCTSGLTKTGGFGKLLQIVNTHVTATSSVSMNGNEFTNISVLNTSITPSSSSSKILVSMYMMGEGTDNDSNYAIRIERDITGGTTGTRLGGVDSGNRLGCFQMLTEGHDSGNTGTTTTYMQFSNYLDSPNTTSACTYKCYIRNSSNSTWYVNRTKDDPDNVGGERGHAYCTLMEVQS